MTRHLPLKSFIKLADVNFIMCYTNMKSFGSPLVGTPEYLSRSLTWRSWLLKGTVHQFYMGVYGSVYNSLRSVLWYDDWSTISDRAVTPKNRAQRPQGQKTTITLKLTRNPELETVPLTRHENSLISLFKKNNFFLKSCLHII